MNICEHQSCHLHLFGGFLDAHDNVFWWLLAGDPNRTGEGDTAETRPEAGNGNVPWTPWTTMFAKKCCKVLIAMV